MSSRFPLQDSRKGCSPSQLSQYINHKQKLNRNKKKFANNN